LGSHGVGFHSVVRAGPAGLPRNPAASLAGVPGTRHSRTRFGAAIRRKHRGYDYDSLELLHPAREAGQALMEQLLGLVRALFVHALLCVCGSDQ